MNIASIYTEATEVEDKTSDEQLRLSESAASNAAIEAIEHERWLTHPRTVRHLVELKRIQTTFDDQARALSETLEQSEKDRIQVNLIKSKTIERIISYVRTNKYEQ
jgi:hypothetical protein